MSLGAVHPGPHNVALAMCLPSKATSCTAETPWPRLYEASDNRIASCLPPVFVRSRG